MAKSKKSIKELRNVLDTHLLYEFKMLKEPLLFYKTKKKIPGLSVFQSMVVEVSIIHARNLIDFFYHSKNGDFYAQEMKRHVRGS